MSEVLPSILADSAETFRERLLFSGFWQPGMTAHIDILDGSMFGTSCFCDPMAIAGTTATSPDPFGRWPTGEASLLRRGDLYIPNIELHCMVRDPLPIIEAWQRTIPQTIRAIIHAEIDRDLDAYFHRIHALDLEAGLALNPETPPAIIESLPHLPDRVLLLGVEPGASGRAFLGKPILAKLKRLRTQFPHLHLSVDGGITQENKELVLKSGASSLVIGSAIWGTSHPRESYEQLIH